MSSLLDLKERLIQARADKERADAALESLLADYPEVAFAISVAKVASIAAKEADLALRCEIEMVYREEGREAVKAVQGLNVRTKNELNIGNIQAVTAWARIKQPSLLVLDEAAFKTIFNGGLLGRMAEPDEVDSWELSLVEIVSPTISATLE